MAPYLMRDGHEAEDLVQDAYLQALGYFGTFRGGEDRPWLLLTMAYWAVSDLNGQELMRFA